MKQKYLNHKRYHESHREKPMELAQKTCVQPQTRSNTAAVPCSRRQDQRPAVTERDAQLDVRWWCFDIDLLTLSASSERRWYQVLTPARPYRTVPGVHAYEYSSCLHSCRVYSVLHWFDFTQHYLVLARHEPRIPRYAW